MADIEALEIHQPSEIETANIIGGALDARTGKIVPVHYVEVFRNDEEGYTLGEYQNDQGEALAMAAEVDQGGRTRRWQLTPAAKKAGYAETETIYDGDGTAHHWKLWGLLHGQAAPSDAGDQPHFNVKPGQSFMFTAGGERLNDPQIRRVGMRVLSFCTRPFDLAYEKVISPPRHLQ